MSKLNPTRRTLVFTKNLITLKHDLSHPQTSAAHNFTETFYRYIIAQVTVVASVAWQIKSAFYLTYP